jgi:hypothetical protein
MAEEYEAHKTAMAAKEAAEAERKANAATISGSVATLMDDGGDDFVKKWSGPMILGALVPAIFAAFICVGGEIILTIKEGQCNFPLNLVVQAMIVVSYLFLLIYSWIWLGDEFYFSFELLNIKRAILWPFQSMKWLMFYYLVIFFTAMIIMAVATVVLNSAALCVETTPKIYSFVGFVLAIYWIMFTVIMLKMIGLLFGNSIVSFIKDKTTAPSQNELEERIFRKSFADFDKDKNGYIDAGDFPDLLQSLGVYIPDEEQPALLRTLDPEKEGRITFDNMYAWFQKLNAQAGDGDDIDDDEDEAFDDFSRKKGL